MKDFTRDELITEILKTKKVVKETTNEHERKQNKKYLTRLYRRLRCYND